MKYILLFLSIMSSIMVSSQEFDITLSTAESGTVTHQARNSITLVPNYSYNPNGGTLALEIVDPFIGDNIQYSYSVVNPETRSLNTSYLVGTTEGSLDVNALGASSYNIPLDLPAGPGGFTPSLSLAYSSNTNNGVVGYGWNIAGISAITRCPQTFYHDGATEAIDLTTSDRFMLDGHRLICTTGTYGGYQSGYRTEIDNFTRLTLYTLSGGSLDYFIADTKSGIEYQYGYTDDASQTIDGLNSKVAWFVNQMTDVYGNKIEFQYIKENGFNYLVNISYGPNSIDFFYNERTDTQISYFLGKTLTQRLILDHIEIKTNNTLIKKYQLKYNYKNYYYNTYSLLNEVIEYGINSSRINSTAFTYEVPDNVSFSQEIYNISNSYVSYGSKLTMGDFNGDGLTDVFTVDNPDISGSYDGYRLYLNYGNNTFYYSSSGEFSYNDSKASFIPSDLNGDGLTDLLIIIDGGQFWDSSYNKIYKYIYTYAISNGNSFTKGETITTEYVKAFNISGYVYDNEHLDQYRSDFDGDSMDDLIVLTDEGWKIYGFSYTNGSLSSSMQLKYSGTQSAFGDEQRIADFDGDGKDELFCLDDEGYEIYELENGSFSLQASSTIPKSNHHFKMGDFNGDGKTDLFLYGYNSYDWSNWQMRLSNGTGFNINYIPRKKTNLRNDIVRIGDFNGDHKSDIMVMADDDAWSGHYYYISKNNGTELYSHYYSGAQISTHNYYIDDYDGDGREEYLCTDGESAWWTGYMIYKSGSTNLPLLSQVGNGLGQYSSITYQTLAESGTHYTKGSGATFPVVDYQGALPVVTSIETDDGCGSLKEVDYNYTGAKIHVQGKGFLCYSKQTIKDVNSNSTIETSYDYNSDYYFPTLASSINKVSSTTISSLNNTWAYKSIISGVIFPYISSSSKINNLTGHTVSSSFEYDNYGNPTSVIQSYDNGVSKEVTYVYNIEDYTNWYLGRMTSSTTLYSKSGESDISNTINITYGSDGIFKPDLIKTHEGTDLYHYVNNDYDTYGNLIKSIEQGTGVSSRQTDYDYDENGINLESVTDPLGHMTTFTYDNYGRISTEENYLSNTVNYSYDNMGRIISKTNSDGFVSTSSYNWGLSGGPDNSGSVALIILYLKDYYF